MYFSCSGRLFSESRQLTVVLPIENYAREIDHKVLLAAYIAKSTSLPVLVAHEPLAKVFVDMSPSSCIYIGKNVFTNKYSFSPTHNPRYAIDNQYLHQLLNAGAHVMFVDEEGGLFLSADGSSRDCELLSSRIPLNAGERLFSHPNLSMFHWGPYQYSHALAHFPNIKHYNSGALFLDAAKIYSRFTCADASIASVNSIAKISITSNSAFLSNIALTDYPAYLSLHLSFFNSTGDWQSAFASEVSMAALADSLSKKKLEVTYRPHPSSNNLISRQWLEYCKKSGIAVSYPSSESSLSYLLSAGLNVHPGCSTSLQSYYLNMPTVKYGHYGYGLPDKLIEEDFACTPDEVQSLLLTPSVPRLGPLTSMLLTTVSRDSLSAFDAITGHIKSIASIQVKRRTSLSRQLLNLFSLDSRRSLRLATRSLFWPSNSSRYGKYLSMYYPDVFRNISYANRFWPDPSVFVAASSPNSIFVDTHS